MARNRPSAGTLARVRKGCNMLRLYPNVARQPILLGRDGATVKGGPSCIAKELLAKRNEESDAAFFDSKG
ncbi:hypothetical protein JCM15519_20820 [Fundidesulfovibrio butyratiphilus]